LSGTKSPPLPESGNAMSQGRALTTVETPVGLG
jgi:hypothetical protein